MKGQNLRSKVLVWRIKHISNRNMILIVAGLTGILSGLAAISLKTSVHFLRHNLIDIFNGSYQRFLIIILPLIGILITAAITKHITKEPAGHGIINILYSISKKKCNTQ